MKIARIFQILAVILLGIAAYFLWLENKDGVLVALVLSGCAYFLNMRFKIKETLKERDERDAAKAESIETEADELSKE